MKLIETSFSGAFVVEAEPHRDERGSFARVFSAREFRERGLEPGLTEISISGNRQAGTLRGMHFQSEPHGETKLVRVVRGRIFDVIVDVRPSSATFGKWQGWELKAGGGRALYIPRGFAHGFLTLEEDSDVLYQISDTFRDASATGFSWEDPEVAIAWPAEPRLLSEKDRCRKNLGELLL